MLLKFQPCPQSAEKYILHLIFLKKYFKIIFGLLADLDLQYLGTPGLNFLTRLQTVQK